MKKFKTILVFAYVIYAVIMMCISRFGFNMYLNNLGTLFLLTLMISDNLFKTVLYAERERKFSNLSIGKLIETMKSEGIEEAFLSTNISDINNVNIGAYFLKISGFDENQKPYKKVLIFSMVFGVPFKLLVFIFILRVHSLF